MQPQQTYQQPVMAPPAPVQYPPKKSPVKIILFVLLGLIIAGAVFAVGLTAGKSVQKEALQKEIDQAQQETAKLQTALENGDSVTDQPGVTYLSIKEWNIRVPLDSKFTDVKYRIRTRLSADFVEIYSPGLVPVATCRDYQGEIGTIEKAAAGTIPISNTHVVGIGKTLYMYKPITETCTSNPANLETPYKNSVLKQFALLESLPKSQQSADTKKDNADGNASSNPNTPVSSEPAPVAQ